LTAPQLRWEVAKPAPQEYLAQIRDLPPSIAQCLYNRGLKSPQEAYAFLSGELEEDDPFRLRGIHQAVARIRQAIRQKERIAVYGDFDADGVAATALLTQTISSLGGEASPYIPHRVDEGYGLHSEAVERLAQEGCRLLVTVDCGIRSIEEVRYARQLGLEVIITDHHSPPQELPPALAIVNPKREDCPYPFKGLSGAGVAFKLAQALLRVERRVPLFSHPSGSRRDRDTFVRKSTPLEEEELIDLVALGTITDLSPLLGENRNLVKRGLSTLNHSPRPGILALSAPLKERTITSQTIGYVLGPRLNAAGRLGDAMASYRLLTTSSPAEAQELALELEERNRQRKGLTLQVLEKAQKQIEGQESEPILFAQGQGFPCGVIGLVASRLCEEFYRPAVVIELGEEESRGSVRSILEFDITKALDECRDLLLRYGGHSLAAGFTVKAEHLATLEERLRGIAACQLSGLELVPTLSIDAEIPLTDLQPAIFAAAQTLEPSGPSNPPPTFLSHGVEVREARLVGETHLRLTLTDLTGSCKGGRVIWDGIAFGKGAEANSLSRHIDIVYVPEIQWWNNEERLQLRVLDLRPASEEGR
jgi:single-stranded-DNA-specific exonuclease